MNCGLLNTSLVNEILFEVNIPFLIKNLSVLNLHFVIEGNSNLACVILNFFAGSKLLTKPIREVLFKFISLTSLSFAKFFLFLISSLLLISRSPLNFSISNTP